MAQNGLQIKKTICKIGGILVAVAGILASITGFTGYNLKDVFSDKEEKSDSLKHDLILQKPDTTDSEDTTVKNTPVIQPNNQNITKNNTTIYNQQGGPVTFSGNTTVNGQIIIDPKEPVIINSNYSITKDSTTK